MKTVFCSPNTRPMMTFLNPLDALIPKIPFSFFAEFRVRVTSGAPGVSLGRILGGPSIEPFLGGGRLARGLYRAPPLPSPKLKAGPPMSLTRLTSLSPPCRACGVWSGLLDPQPSPPRV